MICDPPRIAVQCSHIGGYKPKGEDDHAASGHSAANDASEIIRAVREERAEYVVALRGRPVAFIVPVDEARQEAEASAPSSHDPGECRILRIGWQRCVLRSEPNGKATRRGWSWLRSSAGKLCLSLPSSSMPVCSWRMLSRTNPSR